MFSCEFCEISKNSFFTEHLWATASGVPIILCSFMETFYRRFYILLSSERKAET